MKPPSSSAWQRTRLALAMAAACMVAAPAPASQDIALSATQNRLARIAPDAPSGSVTFTLDGKARAVSIDIGAVLPTLVTSISGPAGQLLTEATVAGFGGSVEKVDASGATGGPGIYPIGSVSHTIYRFPSLGQGDYTIRFEGAGLAEEAAVIVQLDSDSPIAARLFFTDAAGVVGRPGVLCAALADGATALAGASVSARLLDKNGTVSTLTLLDDGSDADGMAGDGIYSALHTPTTAGTYLALATIGGSTPDGATFQRQSTARLDVVPLSATFTGNVGAVPADTNGNGRFEKIVLSAEVDVAEPGTYRTLASLRTAGGKAFQAHAEQALSSGQQQATVAIAASLLLPLREDGPYQIERIDLLFVDHETLRPADTLVNAGETPPLRLDQLERPPIMLTGAASDAGVDANANGLFDQLAVNLEVDLETGGRYQFSARLTDKSGGTLDISAGSAFFSAGRRAIPFVLDGRKIGSRGVNGPYLLDNVLVFGAGASLTALEPAARTRAYTYTQFEASSPNPADVNGDAQVDCADLALVKASFGKRLGQPGFDARTDVNHDNVTDVRDLALVSRALAVGTRCP